MTPHDKQAVFNAFRGAHNEGLGCHDVGNACATGITAFGDHAPHQVALGEDADQLSVVEHGHRSYVALHHDTHDCPYSLSDFHSANFLVPDEIMDARHGAPPRNNRNLRYWLRN